MAATTVRAGNPVPLATDGPFAETKEQLGGFYMVDATDLDDAIKWAGKDASYRRRRLGGDSPNHGVRLIDSKPALPNRGGSTNRYSRLVVR